MRTILLASVSALVLASTLVAFGAQGSEARAVQHLRAGQEALRSERWDIAEREFKTAIELDPLLELAHYGLGQTYMATKRYVEAVRAYIATRDAFHRAAGEQMINNIDAERRLDDQIRTLRDQRRALEAGQYRTPNLQATLIKIDDQIRQMEAMRRPNRNGAPVTPVYISVALGSAYFRTGAFADAEREWRAALQVNPSVGEAHNNLAVVLMLTGRYEEAEREVQLAERAGHRVSDRFKEDLKTAARKAGKG